MAYHSVLLKLWSHKVYIKALMSRQYSIVPFLFFCRYEDLFPPINTESKKKKTKSQNQKISSHEAESKLMLGYLLL